jgi:hypothetical protein
MPVHLLRDRATPEQVAEMLADLEVMIKIVVDIRRGVMTGGGDMHYDGEQLLLEDGSQQSDLWGANWYPSRQTVESEALINIRPRDNNRTMTIQDPEIRQTVEQIARKHLEDVLP